MLTEYDERVINYKKSKYGNYIAKTKDDLGLEDEVKKVNTMPLQLGAFVLSNTKRITNNFIHAIDGLYANDACSTDADSIYIENNHWNKLDNAGLVCKNRLQRKKDNKHGSFWYGLFLAPKIKSCSAINKNGIIDTNIKLSKVLQM